MPNKHSSRLLGAHVDPELSDWVLARVEDSRAGGRPLTIKAVLEAALRAFMVQVRADEDLLAGLADPAIGRRGRRADYAAAAAAEALGREPDGTMRKRAG